jgi:hypothetical protein
MCCVACVRGVRTLYHAVARVFLRGGVHHRYIARLVRSLGLPTHLAREVLLNHVAAVRELDSTAVATLACVGTVRERVSASACAR